MILTTTCFIEGKSILQYLGIVSAAQIMVMPGGNKGVQRGWQAGVEGLSEILLQQADSLGADAIIGIKVEPFGTQICATGTAVKLT